MTFLSKDELEKQKIELEIKELKKPWYSKPAYLGVVIPSAIASISVLSIFLTGWFSVTRESLKIERQHLQDDIEKFTFQKNEIKHQLDSLQIILNRRTTTIDTLRKNNDSLRIKITKLQLEVADIKTEKFKTPQLKIKTVDDKGADMNLTQTNSIKNINPLPNATLRDSLAKDLVLTFTVLQKEPLEFYFTTDSLFREIGHALENYFKSSNFNKDSILITIVGNADELPISPRGLIYGGEFGDLDGAYYSLNEQGHKQINIRPGQRIGTNEELAYLRARFAKQQLQGLLKENFLDPKNLAIQTKVSLNRGNEYRSVQIKVTIKSAIEN